MGLDHSEFMQLFDQWAPTYDDTVFRAAPAEGFEAYAAILERVATLAGAGPGRHLLDVGTGTGNLALTLLRRGATVTAVEPSAGMREQARRKLHGIRLLEGQFLSLPLAGATFDAVVSTYAFHHLEDRQKLLGAREMLRVLRPGGRVVLGDIAWACEDARTAMVCRLEREGKFDLVKEIADEYYPTVGTLTGIFASLGCSVYLEPATEWVWILAAIKEAAR